MLGLSDNASRLGRMAQSARSSRLHTRSLSEHSSRLVQSSRLADIIPAQLLGAQTCASLRLLHRRVGNDADEADRADLPLGQRVCKSAPAAGQRTPRLCRPTASPLRRAGRPGKRGSAIVSLYKILKSQYTAALPSKFVHIIYAMHVMRAACHVSSIYILYTIM